MINDSSIETKSKMMFVKDYKDYDGLNVAVRIRLKLVVPRYGSTWIER